MFEQMTRQKAIEACEDHYGLDAELLAQVIKQLGYDALSDKGVRLLARLSYEREQKLWKQAMRKHGEW